MDNAAPPRKACTVNPLKLSRPLGGIMAFLGLDGSVPVIHGAQGCTAFGLVLLVKHFRESIPFQSTAMSEVSTILGGGDNLEQAILNIAERSHPKVIGICSNGLIETRGEDIDGDLKRIQSRHPELADTALIHAATPDYKGAFQDGWSDALTAIVKKLVTPSTKHHSRQINILAGSHLTAADIEDIRECVAAFGLEPLVLPDISGSLDGHLTDDFTGTTNGGTRVEEIRRMGASIATLAIGEQVREAANLLETRCHIPSYMFPRLTGLLPCDEFVATLSRLSARPVPSRIRRRRSQLLDAMLDGHFYFGGKKVAIAAEPDLLFAYSQFLNEMGAKITCAVTTTTSPILDNIPADHVIIGDLDDIECNGAGSDLLISNSQARRTAARMGIPLIAVGMPLFDRLGAAHRLSVGYRGTRNQIFDIANQFIAQDSNRESEHQPHTAPGGSHAAIAAH
ncbi:MAG: nitrogenase iron-molybdenum cofactor biosynthesis protein NifN [Rhizomicrobium sp.]